jgi:two-component SAPR family response regulator
MIAVLIVTRDNNSFSGLESGLRNKDADISWAASSDLAIEKISEAYFDIIVVGEEVEDMSGLKFVEKVVSINPFLSCAVASPLSHDEFHEVSEGLGVIMQLPVSPEEKHAEELLSTYRKIVDLIN